MSNLTHANPSAANSLCPACGLCCNGVLFADVKLAPGDDAAWLTSHGLPVRQRGRSCSFSQPCAGLQADGRCRIYVDRPQMCRDFECGVLKEVLAGRLTDSEALRVIRRAQRLARKVAVLLEQAGNSDRHQPLTKRYQAVMRQPIDLSAGDEAGDLRGALMLTVHELMDLLHQRFLRADPPAGSAAP